MATLSGILINKTTGNGIANLALELWDAEGILNEPVAKFTSERQGKFKTNIQEDILRRKLGRRQLPKLYLKVFQQDKLIHSTKRSLLWDPTENKLDTRIEISISGDQGYSYTVRGTVTDPQGKGVEGALVRAFDKDLRHEKLLGVTQTDSQGRYTITYTQTQFRRAEKKNADLIVRAYDADGTLLAESSLMFNAQPVETVDLVLPGEELDQSEYERFLAELTPLLDGLTLAELTAEDVSFLAGETGLERRFISFLVSAEKLATITNLAASIHYGFVRENLPTDLPSLLRQGRDAQRLALETAIKNKLIPTISPEGLDATLDQLQDLLVEFTLEEPEEPTKPSLVGLIATTLLPLSRNQKKAFLKLYLRPSEPAENIWESLRRIPEFHQAELVDELEVTVQMGNLTQNHLPLVRTLQRMRKDGKLSSFRELARLTIEDWISLIDQSREEQLPAVPPSITGETETEKAHNYALQIGELLEDTFPTLSVAYRVEQDDLSGRDDLTTFFNRSIIDREKRNPGVPEFDFASTHIDRYLKDHAEAVLADVSDRQRLILQLKSMQRLFKVTPYYTEMKPLLENDIHSAQSIVRLGPGQFVKRFAEHFGGEARVAELYDKAEHRNAIAMAVLNKYGATFNGATPAVVPTPPQPSEEDLEAIPEWPSLFGSLDFCSCKHCQSVYSPAAYLVDALHFLDTACSAKDPNKTAKDVLFERRGDLGKIELSCANTNTPVPYIDLVNEILENTVAKPSPGTPYPQTRDTAEEIGANPEYVNPEAYQTLSNLVFPWSLPFDRWAEECRVYLQQLGTQRYQIIEICSEKIRTECLNDRAIAREYLGLNLHEWNIITGFSRQSIPGLSSHQPWEYWGYAKSPEPSIWLKAVSHVPVFLKKSGLSHPELLELLATRFVNPNPAHRILDISPKNACQLDEMTLSPQINLTKSLLHKIHRFIRLQRNLGWTMQELDQAITALQPQDDYGELVPTDSFVVELSHIERLRKDLKLPIVQILSFWSDIDIANYDVEEKRPSRSLYDKLFQNKTLLGNRDDLEAFALHNLPSAIIGKHGSILEAVLGIGATDLEQLVVATQLQEMLSLTSLSILYRHVLLAKALSLTIPELLTLKSLLAMDPFDPAHTVNTLLFTEKLHKIRATNFSVAQLNYLYRHIDDPVKPIAPTAQDLIQLPQTLMGELNRIAEETEINAPSEDLFRTHLATLLVETQVRAAMDFLDTSPTDTPENRETIVQFFGLFLPEAPDYAQLLAPSEPQNEKEKQALKEKQIAYLLPHLMAYLRNQQGRTAIKQILSETLKLDKLVTASLLDTILRSRQNPGNPDKNAIDDFLVLKNAGLLATYAGKDSQGEAVKVLRIDPCIDFDWGTATPAKGIVPDTLQQIIWEGKLLAPSNEVYAFHLDAAGAVALEINVNGEFLELSSSTGDYPLSSPPISLTAGALSNIRLTYTPSVGEKPRVRLCWSSPSISESVIPQSLLYPDDSYSYLTQSYSLLWKAALLVTNFKLTAKEIEYMSQHSEDFEELDFNTLPLVPATSSSNPVFFRQWERLHDFAHLRDSLPGSEVGLTDVFALASSPIKAREKLVQATGWDIQELSGLTTGELKNEARLIRLRDELALSYRLGVTTDNLRDWCQYPSNSETAQKQAQAIKNALKSRYEDGQWLAVAKPLKNKLREQQRSALVDYLLTRPQSLSLTHLDDTNDLYDHLLIDVEMSACQMTSRIKQANSSVQLFVQRCLMGLEKQASLDESAANQWKWMKNYRVWEANRKVFLYPENWIEPELRDDKSPFFKEMESDLLQGEINLDTVETAFRNYLTKLDEVSNLEICGMFQQLEIRSISKSRTNQEGIPETNILHIFGRTRGETHTYFYRQWVDGSYWTPWEKVNVDIQGDHLVPVVFERKLRLFWPIFSEKTYELTPEEKENKKEPRKYWEIKLAWSEYKNNKWSEKKVLQESINTINFCKKSQYTFIADAWRTSAFGIILRITCIERPQEIPKIGSGDVLPNIDLDTMIGFFNFNDFCHGSIKTYPDTLIKPFYGQLGTNHLQPGSEYYDSYNQLLKPPVVSDKYEELYEYMKFSKKRTNGALVFRDYSDSTLLNGYQYTLNNTLGNYELLFPRMYGLLEKSLDDWIKTNKPILPVRQAFTPFFFQDEKRQFFVTPQLIFQDVNALSKPFSGPASGLNYRFSTFFHPYTCEFIKQLNRYGIDGLLDPPEPTSLLRRQFLYKNNFKNTYIPSDVVEKSYPIEYIDFTLGGAYSLYNWELFFHAPLLIADRLMKNQRFEDAQKWFHYIFDPTIGSDPINIPQLLENFQNLCKDVLNIVGIDYDDDASARRFWKIRPFFLNSFDQISIQQLMELLAYEGNKPGKQKVRAFLETVVDQWRKDPFKPHLIARMLISPYQKTVVMKYLDNLIAWADNLFRRDTIESINEATQLYILAAKILGPRPAEIHPRKALPVKTYDDLEPELDAFSNAIVQIENQLYSPITLRNKNLPLTFQQKGVVPDVQHSAWSSVSATLSSPSLYFCVPPNEDMLEYWDTISDRLFKVRHCMNIEGVERQLPLFEPPINPALLVKAAAAGLDIGSVLQDLYAPLPKYRFQVMLQKSLELCSEVKALGAALLSALEKKDAESLSLLRASDELELLNYATQLKEKHVEEAKESVTTLKKAESLAKARKQHYSGLLSGVTASLGALTGLPIGLPLNSWEAASLSLNTLAIYTYGIGASSNIAAAISHMFPEKEVGTSGNGGHAVGVHGGTHTGQAGEAAAAGFKDLSTVSNMGASLSVSMGSFVRRKEEWELQLKLAELEELHIQQQIVVATIRQEITEQELQYHTKQIEKAEAVKTFMQNKFTNQELYSWMVSQISAVYFQSYKLANDTAKQAERAYRYELGLDDSNYIQFGYWDSLHKGLLAGEKLYHDIKRMDLAYLDQNKREYELTKHISLVTLDPMALIQLRKTGECFVTIPEVIFDIDFPGHYMRRIKNASLTIPCITGPYTNVSCTLTLLKNSVRRNVKTTPKYVRNHKDGLPQDDSRFLDDIGAIESIATSSAQNDSGLYELNFRDERYLPFEGAGAISTWRIELPEKFKQFDYDTISDLVIHLRYTAREGGQVLKEAANKEIKRHISNVDAKAPLARLFSARHEFPNEWHRFLHPASETGDQNLTLALTKERFPFLFQGKTITINKIELFIKSDKIDTFKSFPQLKDKISEWNDLLHAEIASPILIPDSWTLETGIEEPAQPLKPEDVEDIIVVCHYSVT